MKKAFIFCLIFALLFTVLSTAPVAAAEPDEAALTIRAGETLQLYLDEENSGLTILFTPEKTATYTFESSGELDVEAYLELDSKTIEYNNDSGVKANFRLVADCEEGLTYKINISEAVSIQNYTAGEFELTVYETQPVPNETSHAAVEYIPSRPIVLRENLSGEWVTDEDGEPFFLYHCSFPFFSSDRLRVSLDNGEVKEYTLSVMAGQVYALDEQGKRFFFQTGSVLNEFPYADIWEKDARIPITYGRFGEASQRKAHWLPDRENHLTISQSYQYNSPFDIPVTIKKAEKTPVGIDFTPVVPYIGTSPDYHYYSQYLKFRIGDSLTVTYDDGSHENFIYSNRLQDGTESFGAFRNAEDEELYARYDIPEEYDYDTNESIWHTGKNLITLTAAGLSTQVPFTILEDPVESISFTPAREIILYENLSKNDTRGCYQSGSVLTLNMKDGSTESYTMRFDYYTDGYGFKFVDDNGILLEEKYLEGGFTIYRNGDFSIDKENSFTFRWNGFTAQIPVTLRPYDHEAVKLEIQPVKPLVYQEGEGGSYNDKEDYYNYNYYTDLLYAGGTTLTVSYKDGSRDVFTCYYGGRNFTYGTSYYIVDQNGDNMNYAHLSVSDNQSGENPWTPERDDCCVTVSYLDQTVSVPVTITTAADRTLLGDSDGDGKVSIIDATQIQKKLAQLPTVSSFNENAARIDGTKLNILHATYIQKFLAHLPCPLGIGEPINR